MMNNNNFALLNININININIKNVGNSTDQVLMSIMLMIRSKHQDY